MKLLTLTETNVLQKKQGDDAQVKAGKLSVHISELIKSFNKSKDEIARNKELVYGEYKQWREEVDNERQKIEDEVKALEHKRDTALEPLYKKEKQLNELSSDLGGREEVVSQKERDLTTWEKDLTELKETCDEIVQDIEKRESKIGKREESISLREIKFIKHRKGQEELFKQNEQRLRDWLEKERAKIRNA